MHPTVAEHLQVCAEQIGWLFSVPEFDTEKSQTDTPTRWESTYGKDCEFSIEKAELPISNEDGLHLLYALQELGWCHRDAMGNRVAHSYTEIVNYSIIRGGFSRDELYLLKTLSIAWVNGYYNGSEPLSRAPIDKLNE